MSKYRTNFETCDQILLSVRSLLSKLLSCLCRAPFLTRCRVCHLSFSVCSNLPASTSSIYVTCVLQFSNCENLSRFEVTLRLTVSQSVCLGIEHPCRTCDQILLPVRMLLSEICGLVSVGHPL
jgi:hypothetical protein